MHEECIPHSIPSLSMRTVRVKQEKEEDTKIMVKEKYEIRKQVNGALFGGKILNKTLLAPMT